MAADGEATGELREDGGENGLVAAQVNAVDGSIVPEEIYVPCVTTHQVDRPFRIQHSTKRIVSAQDGGGR